jgi:hypothetical protein
MLALRLVPPSHMFLPVFFPFRIRLLLLCCPSVSCLLSSARAMPSSPSQFWPEQTRRSRTPVAPLLPTPPSTQPSQTLPTPAGTHAQSTNSSVLPPIGFRDGVSGLLPQAPTKRSFTASQHEVVPFSPPSFATSRPRSVNSNSTYDNR